MLFSHFTLLYLTILEAAMSAQMMKNSTCNDVMNTLEDARKSSMQLLKNLNTSQTYQFWEDYNATDGLAGDLYRTMHNKFGFETMTSQNIAQRLHNNLQACKDAGVDSKFHLIGHSEGGAAIYNGMNQAGEEIEQNLPCI